jgi:hypothetical protein
MSIAIPERPDFASGLPDHTQLPDTDGSILENFQENPQSKLLRDTIVPALRRLHPVEARRSSSEGGSPDWIYVPGVPARPKGRVRRSYVLWYVYVHPLIILEYVSGDSYQKRDCTPQTGEFWIYERRIQPKDYGVYEVDPGRIEM